MSSRFAAKRICLFNHKGGVGKTTLTVNLACALSELGHCVLVVDSDPQCNITSYFLDDEVVDKMLDESEGEDGVTLWSALRGPTDGDGLIKPIPAIELAAGPRLHLLPGDIRMATFEATLEESWNYCLKRMRRGFVGTTALSRVVNAAAKKIGADFVFYDTGPNVGPLNRIIVLDSDHFIVPAACDLFSLRALKTLGRSIEDWVLTWRAISEAAPDDTYLLPGLPHLLGFIAQGFRVYSGGPVADAGTYLARIEKGVYGEVAAPLRKIAPELASGSLSKQKLAQIQHFGALIPLAQQQGRALWRVDGGNAGLKDAAKTLFRQAAERIVKRSESHDE